MAYMNKNYQITFKNETFKKSYDIDYIRDGNRLEN